MSDLPIEERAWNGLAAIISQFVDNDFFIKSIGSTLIHDVFRYKDFDFFAGLVKNMGFSENEIKNLHGDLYFGLGQKQGIFRWIEFYNHDYLD